MISVPTLVLALLTAVQAVDAASAGCGKSPPTSSGTKSMTVNGKQRQYILQLPSNYDSNKAYRVIFGYHWRDGSMSDVANGGFYSLRSLASDSTIFVAPNGLNAGWANNGGEDMTFTDQIVAQLKTDFCVDEGQFFATGWSYGGSMSHSVACSRPGRPLPSSSSHTPTDTSPRFPNRRLQSRSRHRRRPALRLRRRHHPRRLPRDPRRSRRRAPHRARPPAARQVAADQRLRRAKRARALGRAAGQPQDHVQLLPRGRHLDRARRRPRARPVRHRRRQVCAWRDVGVLQRGCFGRESV